MGSNLPYNAEGATRNPLDCLIEEQRRGRQMVVPPQIKDELVLH